MSRWRLQKIDTAGTVLNEWVSDANDASQLGLGSPFQWSTGRLGDLRELTFEADLAQKPFSLGEYVRLYTDFNGDGTETLSFTGLVTEVPGSNRGYAGTVRVSGLRRLLEGIPAPRKEYLWLITEPINDILALLPPLVPIAVNDSVGWTQTVEYWYAGHVSAAAALDDLVALAGGTWSVADNGLNIRGPGYFADYVPGGTYYVVAGPAVKDEPYTAVRVRLNDVGGKAWSSRTDAELYQTEQPKGLGAVPQFALGQSVITDPVKHATQPYYISVGVGDGKAYESRVPASIEVRRFSSTGVLGTTTSLTNDGTATASFALDANAGLIFSPPAALFSPTSAIVGCLWYVAFSSSVDTDLAIMGAGGQRLPASGSLGAHILSLAESGYRRVATTASEWNDFSQNAHTLTWVRSTPSAAAAAGGEVYTGYRDYAVIQAATGAMWQPMVVLRNASILAASVTVSVYMDFFVTTQANINSIVTARAPVPVPYSVATPYTDPHRWLTVSAPGYPTFTIDHCEYTMSNEEGAITRMFAASGVDPFINRQATATIKGQKGRI